MTPPGPLPKAKLYVSQLSSTSQRGLWVADPAIPVIVAATPCRNGRSQVRYSGSLNLNAVLEWQIQAIDLHLLRQWAMVGGSCDFDGGGVGINAFLELLGHWGSCP